MVYYYFCYGNTDTHVVLSVVKNVIIKSDLFIPSSAWAVRIRCEWEKKQETNLMFFETAYPFIYSDKEDKSRSENVFIIARFLL